jgi:hypothetical protein
MTNYANGKVYKIYSPSQPELGDYYGSTTQSLALRIGQHRSNAKRGQCITSAVIIAAGDAVIVLVELCPVGTKEELHAREAFWIRGNPCVNKVVPGRTVAEKSAYNAEYRATHKVTEAAYQADYRAAHKPERAAYHAAYSAAHKVEEAAYRAANRDRINERRRERYAAKKAAAAAV